MLKTIREKFSYANIAATMALFVALGGTSYAVSMPRDSVGSRELKSGSVGSAELAKNAVTTRAIKNKTVSARDLTARARRALQGIPGPQGPQGNPGTPAVSYRLIVNAAGFTEGGHGYTPASREPNVQIVEFQHSVAGCVPVATVTNARLGMPADGGGGRIAAAIEGERVAVRTWDAAGNPQHLPFNLIVAC